MGSRRGFVPPQALGHLTGHREGLGMLRAGEGWQWLYSTAAPLGGHFTSQGEVAHASPSDKEVSPLKRLLDLNVTWGHGHTLGYPSHRLHASTLCKTYTKFYTLPCSETASVPKTAFCHTAGMKCKSCLQAPSLTKTLQTRPPS